MLWVDWLAWASMAVPAWTRTWFWVNFVISDAMSVSLMRDSEAVVFSMVVFRLLMVCWNRFCLAPMSARTVDTWVIAAASALIAAPAPEAAVNDTLALLMSAVPVTPPVVPALALPVAV